MNIERRFAIIIGINDYAEKPLDCCVNDAKAVAVVLESRCRFKQEDIYLITSDESAPVKDITGHFDSAIKNIQSEITAQADSVFFFFAGHGKYQFDNSGLKFQDSYMEISNIFKSFNDMQPKYQCYVVDACESGGKVLTRGEKEEENFITNFIAQSTGTLFMYAATENETAKELSALGHGLFTNYFLDAINNDSLYDDGVLTPNRIQDYIAKQTLKESNFKQTPVIENRTIGYYPFAFNHKYSEESIATPTLETPRGEAVSEMQEEQQTIITEQYFPVVPRPIRTKLFENLEPKFKEIISSWISNFESSGYTVTEADDLGIFPSDVEDKLKDRVVNTSVSEKMPSIEGVFSSERELIKPDRLFALGSMIDAMLKKNEPEYRYYNYINWNKNNLIAKSVFFKSDDVQRVSFGFSYMVYQAVYGIALVDMSFYLDYNGFVNDNLKGPFIKIKAYKVNPETITNVIEAATFNLKFLEGRVKKWNEDRMASIKDFDSKSR